MFTACLLVNMFADVFKVLLAGRIRNKLTIHNLSIINKVSGTILIAFAFVLLYGIIFLSNRLPGH